MQDRGARGEVWWVDVRHEAALEALTQPRLERAQIARRTVGGHDDLAPNLIERVECVKELLFGTRLSL